MLKAIQKKLKNKNGFTLVELIVVIAILGILAAIMVPKFTGFNAKAKAQADVSNTKIIQNSVEVYEAEKGHYPTTDTEMSALVKDYLKGSVPEIQVLAADAKETNKFYMKIADGKVEIKPADDADYLEVKK